MKMIDTINIVLFISNYVSYLCGGYIQSCSVSKETTDVTAIKGMLWSVKVYIIKFIYSEKATKFCEISTVDLTITD